MYLILMTLKPSKASDLAIIAVNDDSIQDIENQIGFPKVHTRDKTNIYVKRKKY